MNNRTTTAVSAPNCTSVTEDGINDARYIPMENGVLQSSNRDLMTVKPNSTTQSLMIGLSGLYSPAGTTQTSFIKTRIKCQFQAYIRSLPSAK